jgi:hypothetical protein
VSCWLVNKTSSHPPYSYWKNVTFFYTYVFASCLAFSPRHALNLIVSLSLAYC